jgi:hypothetical protein
MDKNDKSEDTIQITISKEVQDQLDSIVNMLIASGSNGRFRSYNQAIRYALIRARLWDERGRMDTANDIFFCYDLSIHLTSNDCCHEDDCPYATRCLLIKPLSVDAFGKKGDTAKKNMSMKRLAVI